MSLMYKALEGNTKLSKIPALRGLRFYQVKTACPRRVITAYFYTFERAAPGLLPVNQ